MGKDIHIYVPEAFHPKYKVDRKIVMTGYELSRRNDTIANMTGRAVCVLINNPITNAVNKVTRGYERKIMQASKAFGAGRLTRKEGHDTVFTACVGTELTETLCDELEVEMTLVNPAPLHYADARKRPDAEKWKAAEKVEIKNCFDNVKFEVYEAKEVSHDTKVMNCVFSYKVKTDSEGNETQCKARLNCDGRYQSESTYYQFDVKSAFLIPECREEIYINITVNTVFQTAKCCVFGKCCMDSRIQYLIGTNTSLNG